MCSDRVVFTSHCCRLLLILRGTGLWHLALSPVRRARPACGTGGVGLLAERQLVSLLSEHLSCWASSRVRFSGDWATGRLVPADSVDGSCSEPAGATAAPCRLWRASSSPGLLDSWMRCLGAVFSAKSKRQWPLRIIDMAERRVHFVECAEQSRAETVWICV